MSASNEEADRSKVALQAAKRGLEQARAHLAYANEEVLRAHKMNGPNVSLHVDSAIWYREAALRRLSDAEEAYADAKHCHEYDR